MLSAPSAMPMSNGVPPLALIALMAALTVAALLAPSWTLRVVVVPPNVLTPI